MSFELLAVIKMCHIQSQIVEFQRDDDKLFHLHEALADLYCNMACYLPAIKHYKTQVEIYHNVLREGYATFFAGGPISDLLKILRAG